MGKPAKPPPDASPPATQEELSPELREALELAFRALQHRRKMGIYGYLGALALMIGGGLGALYYMSLAEPGEFRGWALLLPLAAGGVCLWVFGRLSRKS